MSKILDMAKDFEQNSKQQANAIEKRLSEEFTRHEKAIAKALKSSEERMSAAIAELRRSGETVVCVLPGHESEVDEFHCDRELVQVAGRWVVQSCVSV